MKLLFVHPNMPGQYKHLAPAFANEDGNEVVFLTLPKPKVNIPGIKKIEYETKRDSKKDVHRYVINMERAVFRAQEVWRACNELKKKGFVPDVIVGHLGWGDGMFLKDIYHDTPILSFMEFFYDAYRSDVVFLEGEEKNTADEAARIRMKNAIHLFNLTYCDWGTCPTFFQLKQHPKEFFPKISVIHDGIDTDAIKPGTGRTLTLPNGTLLKPSDEIVTYIARNFEPYRGFPTFMRAAEMILKRRPNCHILMIGADDVSYGKKPKPGEEPLRLKMMKEVDLPKDRFHHLGYLPHDKMLKVLQISSAHIYLTVPFVLSWSMMEAMACSCLMITSSTDPVLEVIEDGKNGLLVDFFSHEEIADKVDDVFKHPDRMQEIRDNARKTVEEKYSLKKLLPMHMQLVRDVAERKTPPPTAEKIEKFNQKHLTKAYKFVA